MLSAVIAEINPDDLTALGLLRWSSQGIPRPPTPTTPSPRRRNHCNQETFSGQKNNLPPGSSDTHTSVLDVSVNLNLVFQALSRETRSTSSPEPHLHLRQPGRPSSSRRDIPFIDESQTTDNGTLNQTFDYRAVVSPSAPPAHHHQQDVDLPHQPRTLVHPAQPDLFRRLHRRPA